MQDVLDQTKMNKQESVNIKTAEKDKGAFIALITLVATLGGLLFGFDTGVISGAIGTLQDYFQLSSTEKGWAASSAIFGCIGGALIAGFISYYLGRKKSLIIAAILFLVSAIGSALPDSFFEFVTYRIVGGVGVGIASMVSPMYIAEMAPANIRGRLVSFNQLAIVMGFVIVFFVNYFIAKAGDDVWDLNYGWRWMFASEALPAVLFLLLLVIVPESPRWLVIKNQIDKARFVLSKVRRDSLINKELDEIRASVASDKEKSMASSGSLFKGLGLLLFIGIMLSVFQQITGINAILYYGPDIFENLNVGKEIALVNQIVVGLSMMTFTVLAIFTVDKFGRRPLMMIGTLVMCVSIVVFGLLVYTGNLGIPALIFLVLYIAGFSLSLGPVVWVLLSEIFPNRVRAFFLSIAVFAQWFANFIVSQTFPMMNDKEGIWHVNAGFPFWLFGGMCVLTVIFIYFLVPETKEKSLEEIEKFWEK